ncbi:MAG: iron-containing alcohol dehydrogenase, partial [Planctomycetota bacterium]|nr:iron-containing alcohol dehydrogenase [Planctomycetota bacterium]
MAKLKITYPTYHSPRKVVLGTGAVRCLPDIVDVKGAAFFVTGSPAAQQVLIQGLGKGGIDYDKLAKIEKPPGEPDDAMVQQGADFLRARQGSAVVGVGGGSVMDWCRLAWARAVGRLAAGSNRLGSPVDARNQAEFYLVPTTCATGAEASNVAVYSDSGRKQPVVADEFVPSGVILDARFLDSVDTGLLENSLSDALSHAIESYLSIVPNGLAKENAISALQLIFENYPQPPDTCRSERLMQAGYLGGLAAAHCSVGVVHAFAHTVSRWGVRHGHANALGLRAGIRANADTPAMQE